MTTMISTQSKESDITGNYKRFSKRKLLKEKLTHWWVQYNDLKTKQERDIMTEPEFKEKFMKLHLDFNERVQSFITRGWPKDISVSKLAECGFCFTGDSDVVVCFSCKGKLKDWGFGNIPLERHLKMFPRCKFARSLSKKASKVTFDSPGSNFDEDTASCEEQLEVYFKSEFNRLVSFRNCSLSSYVDPYELAAAGLYYVGDWSENGTTQDKLQVPHYCCLSVKNEGNVSLTDEEKRQAELFFPKVEKREMSEVTEDVDGPDGGNRTISVDRYHRHAAHPEYADKNKRIQTFKTCLSNFPIPVQSLAEAGFYSTNSEDEVTCFFCDGKLVDWEPQDYPWEEHARNFPDCQWMLKQIPDQSLLGSIMPSLKNPHTVLGNLESRSFQSRINSFLENGWSLPILVSKLSEAGFVHSGDQDTTECLSCHVKINDWKDTDDPLYKHQEKSPNCELVKALTKELPQYTKAAVGKVNAENDTEVTAECEVDSASAIRKLGSALLSTDKKSDNDKFKSEYQRLLSYYDWPLRGIVDPFDLACAGFYWKESDPSVTVKCFACYGEITEWQIGEKPYRKHEKLYPSCPFINNLETRNKKLTETEKSKVSSLFRKRAEPRDHLDILVQQNDTHDGVVCRNDSSRSEVSHRDGNLHRQHIRPNEIRATCSSETSDGLQTPQEVITSNGVKKSAAEYPEFLKVENRLDSFINWPPNHCQRPNDLATAGFFFKGKDDNVLCFHCGGKLNGWERDDRPWEEHARHYPNCGWLREQKGMKFTNDIEKKYRTSKHVYETYRSEKDENPAKTMGNTTLPDKTSLIVSETSLAEEIQKLKERRLCKSCLDDDVEILFLPCKHLVLCEECSKRMESCPICQSCAEERIRVFVP